MFTTQDSVDAVVLKTVAFQCAVGSDVFGVSAQQRKTTAPGPHRSPLQKHTSSSAPATTEPSSFTFHVPRGDATARSFNALPQHHRTATSSLPPDSPAALHKVGMRGQQRNALIARSALRSALQRHEDALRAWADEPIAQASSSDSTQTALLRPASLRATAAPLLASPVGRGSSAGLPARHVRTHGANLSPAASVEAQHEAMVSAVQPYTRVLAKGSIAGIGLPHRGAATIALGASINQATEATAEDPAAATRAESWQTSTSPSRSSSEDGYVASPSSVSDTSAKLPRCNMAQGGMCAAAAPLTPYQLPLHLRWETPALASSAAASTPALHHEFDEDRRVFLREQAQRYEQWRHHQAAVLHQLAPDMWGRTLPLYAALDQTPHVMDGGLRNTASAVRRTRYDSGVVYV